MKKDLILQVNIPFCTRRCAYCGSTVCAYDPSVSAAYVKALLREIEAAAPEAQDHRVRAVSLEGGCPTLLEPAGLQTVLRAIRHSFALAEDVQISLQTMPGDYSRALMEKMRDNGVNFWIVGLETAELPEHELLRRPYRFDALTMVDAALRTFHPRDLSFELLYGIPGQTERSFRHTLEVALAYEPDHLTLYPLLYPTGSALQIECAAGLLEPLEPQRADELRALAGERLAALGYHAYTQYDYCLPGKENCFRLGQLQGAEQLGLGYDALTRMDGFTYRNGHSLQEYLDHADDLSILARDVAELKGEPPEHIERSRAERQRFLIHGIEKGAAF